MTKIMVTAEVNNLDAWEKRFRSHGDLFRQMAVSRMDYGTVDGNRVAVCGETNDVDAFMAVLKSSATEQAMASDGVKRDTVRVFVLDKGLTV